MVNYLANQNGCLPFLKNTHFFYIFGRFVKMKCRTFLRMAQKCTVKDIILPFHSAITCSKLTIETLEQEVKYVQS